MTKKLDGKTAVITGGTEGIGLATAKLFVQEGAYVFITDRRQKELDEAVKAIGSNVSGVQGDVAQLADLEINKFGWFRSTPSFGACYAFPLPQGVCPGSNTNVERLSERNRE